MNPLIKYTGEKQYQPQADKVENTNRLQYPKDEEGRTYHPYIADADLQEAVNLAIALERPLLLEGAPGCGKARLANALVYEFTVKYLRKKKGCETSWWPFYTWSIKSSSRARDGLYSFDGLARLRDAQLIGSNPDRLREYIDETEFNRLTRYLKDNTQYLKYRALGNALRKHTESDSIWKNDYRAVVLIDEIDKADGDFCNDLLLEMEEWRFDIPELNQSVPPPDQKPIVVITSNQEKPLPEPFLRRCIYYYLDFPDEKRLWDIVEQRFGKQIEPQSELGKAVMTRFNAIRDLLCNHPGSRPPGTSEFLEFLSALLNRPSLQDQLTDLATLKDRLPLLGTLLKTKTDRDLYRSRG